MSCIRASLSRSRPSTDSRTQRLMQLIDAAEKDGLPRIPREQPEDEATTRADDLDRHEHEGVEKRFEFHRRTAVFSAA